MYSIRPGDMNDFYFVVEIDLLDEGIERENPYLTASFDEQSELLGRLAQFLEPSLNTGETELETCPKYAFIYEDIETKETGWRRTREIRDE